jgi:hypothetical protein
LSGLGTPSGTPTTIRYDEGAEVGDRWYAKKNEKPLYAFGYGLSYASFSYSDLKVSGGDTIMASFIVTNTGKQDGADVPQLYLTEAADDKRVRLLGFEKVELHPGESRRVTITADPRLLHVSTRLEVVGALLRDLPNCPWEARSRLRLNCDHNFAIADVWKLTLHSTFRFPRVSS